MWLLNTKRCFYWDIQVSVLQQYHACCPWNVSHPCIFFDTKWKPTSKGTQVGWHGIPCGGKHTRVGNVGKASQRERITSVSKMFTLKSAETQTRRYKTTRTWNDKLGESKPCTLVSFHLCSCLAKVQGIHTSKQVSLHENCPCLHLHQHRCQYQ